MPDLFDHDDLESQRQHYWYALIGASPAPETGESANVAVLLGNGRANYLRYLERLPRLTGLASIDEINVYRAILQSVSEAVYRGIDLNEVRAMLGPQLVVREPRRLFSAPEDAILEQLVHRYLAMPASVHEVNLNALIARSEMQLDKEIQRVKRRGFLVQANVRPSNLYQDKIDRYVPFTVPKLARALRGGTSGRDVLLDGLVVDADADTNSVRMATTRIGQAFWVYDDQLRKVIKGVANREFRTVGILQPGKPTDSRSVLALREYIRQLWSQHAIVIDGNAQDVTAELSVHASWAAGE